MLYNKDKVVAKTNAYQTMYNKVMYNKAKIMYNNYNTNKVMYNKSKVMYNNYNTNKVMYNKYTDNV